MNLSPDQIQQLYRFTRTHFVEYYDLQTELVDHLANGIEEQIRSKPNTTFQESLNLEFKKFGVFGFHDVIRDKTKSMEKRYWKILFSSYKEYFKLPKILLFLLFVAFVYTALSVLPLGYKGYVIASTFLLAMGVIFAKSIRNRKFLKNKNKKWLLEEMILNHTNSVFLLNLGIQICIYPNNLESLAKYPIGIYIISFMLVAVILLFYIMVFVIPPRVEEFLMQTYPEYKMI